MKLGETADEMAYGGIKKKIWHGHITNNVRRTILKRNGIFGYDIWFYLKHKQHLLNRMHQLRI